ncbi:MAG: hypothetical protein BZY73_02605, partial [SAR202 cluster bacterium Casp-Chloro-G3]
MTKLDMTRLTNRFQQDEFLSKQNEIHLLEQGLEELLTSVRESWLQIYRESCGSQNCLTQRLIEVDNRVKASREVVSTLLGNATSLPDLKGVQQLTAELEGLYKTLYMDVRTETSAALGELARQGELIQEMFDELDRAYLSRVETLPEQITLLSRSDGRQVPVGQSILQIESSGLEESARGSPFPLLKGIGLRIYYRSLKRLYRVSEPRPRDTALACLHRAARLGPSPFINQYDQAAAILIMGLMSVFTPSRPSCTDTSDGFRGA